MIVPVGERYQQNLYLFRKENGQLASEALRATFFVPMTGEAEERRRVLPDPTRPSIANGSFEELDSEDRPAGWHYQRQLTLVTDPEQAQDGQRYVRFANETPGKGCRALQGFPVDGRQVAALRIGFHVRGRNIRYGQQRDQWPMLTVTFYDERRAAIATEIVGPYSGTFDWRRVDEAIRVPLRARDAIVRIGLLGGIGEIDFDGLQVSAVE